MGAAPIPNAGLVLLVMIMDTVGVEITSLFSVIIAIDFFTDRMETSCNVFGDGVAAGCINAIAKRAEEADLVAALSIARRSSHTKSVGDASDAGDVVENILLAAKEDVANEML